MMNDDLARRLVLEDTTEEEDEEYLALKVHVDNGHRKHDITSFYSVYEHRPSGNVYVVNYDCSSYDGIDEDSVYWFEAQRIEQIIVKYVPLKKGN